MASAPITFTGTRKVAGQVAQFRSIMDPQQWQTNVPVLWKCSRLIDNNGVPPDRDKDPGVLGVSPNGWHDKFFYEVVVLPIVSENRNVLKTSFAPTPTRIEFSYMQYECLSGAFLGAKFQGGIDVDEGGALCEQTDAANVTLTISKKVRFTQPVAELPIVDLVSGVAVKLVMELLLLMA